MSQAGDLVLAGLRSLRAHYDPTTVSYAHGSGGSTKTIADALKGGTDRAAEEGGAGLDGEPGQFFIPAAEFSTATGWSGGVAVNPSPGDEITEGGRNHEVQSVTLHGGVAYEFVTFRRVGRGSA